MAQGKRRPLQTRALGGEPAIPAVSALADWISKRRADGEAGDLTTCLLQQSFMPQLDAGISIPCAGGKFYTDRLLSCFVGIENGRLLGETGISDRDLIADALEVALLRKGTWWAFPAPHLLAITDEYHGDEREASAAVADLYRAAMRAMRDNGIAGHVLICDHIVDTELAALAGRKAFFFHPDPKPADLELLLEFQHRIAVDRHHLDDAFSLSQEYDIRELIIVDPDPASLTLALSHLDPDQVVAGGYCMGSAEDYWKGIVSGAVYTP